MTDLNYQERQELKRLENKYSGILNNKDVIELANWYSNPKKNIGVGKLFLGLLGSIDDKVLSKN